MQHTWAISGQSNAVGTAAGVIRVPASGVTMWTPGGAAPATDPLAFVDPTGAAGADGPVGPWVTAANAFVYYRPGDRVHLTGWAKPSQRIAAWAATGDGWRTLAPRLTKDVTAFVWFQGESDAAVGTESRAYAAQLQSVIARVRAMTRPDLPVVILGLADDHPSYPAQYWAIRWAQRVAAVEVSPRAHYVSTAGLPLSEGNPFHLSYDGYTALGKRVADVLVDLYRGVS